MGKRAIIFSLALMLTLSCFGCGKDEQKAAPKSEENTTEAAETTEASEKYKDCKGVDLSLGMLDYVEKSRESSANSTANILFKAMLTVFVDHSWQCEQEIVYGTTAEGEVSEEMKKYFTDDKDFEYIVGFTDDGQPEWLICCGGTSRKDIVGIYGDVEDADGIRELKWKKVLDKYGFEYQKYTDFTVKEYEYTTSQQERHELDLDDPDVEASCMLAAAIQKELYMTWEEDTLYLYGKWSKDTPFNKSSDWEFPEHGDIEYIVVMYGDEIGRVLCWDTSRDKKYVGDSDMGFGYGRSYADMTWDDVLKDFGYTQGEYIEYDNNERN